MPNTPLGKEEHERRLNLYSPHKSYVQMSNEMFLSPKGVESWIRRYGLRQPYGLKQKLRITPTISIWEYKNGVVGKNIKRRTYVKTRPQRERDLVRSFISLYLELNRSQKVNVGDVMRGFRKETKGNS